MKAVVTGAGAGLALRSRSGWPVRAMRSLYLIKTEMRQAARRRTNRCERVSGGCVKPEQVADVFSRIGAVDLLVNNAGIARFGPLLEQSAADMQDVINVNLMGTALCAQQAAKQMIQQGAGCIINLSSINAVTPGPNVGLYAATKAAVQNLTILQALEWGPMGVRVNAIAPGFIDAGMSAPFFEKASVREKRASGVPLRRLGQADDVVNAVVYLQSEAAQYVSGHQLVVDGGVVGSLLAHLPRD